MRTHLLAALAGAVLVSGLVAAQTPGAAPATRLNPVIGLLEHKKPVFGLYIPSNRTRPGAAPAAAAKSPAELAAAALANKQTDFLFDGSMEGGMARALPGFSAFVAAMQGLPHATASPRQLTHPLIVKTPELAEPTVHADIATQLNLGVSGLMLPTVETPEQVEKAIAAMRFASKGGTRPDAVGSAPAFWGLSEAEYKARADVWPLNPQGELINWTIIESKAGLARVRDIARVKGIGVLWPGAGTLRGLFTTTGANGERVFDEKGWEAAIQSVLAACKEFGVACGYPANASDIELRMKQGFSVFVMQWGEPGFKAVETGRRAANRTN